MSGFLLISRPATAQNITGFAPAAVEIDVSVPNASTFSDNELGLYLCRPASPNAANVYRGTISTEELIGTKKNFSPQYQALMRQNDQWVDITEVENPDFYFVEEDVTSYSVSWYLKETAPAAVYAVRCLYEEEHEDYTEQVESTFQILYTEDWTYINVAESDTGVRRIRNFAGGEEKTLYLRVTFNDGAANPSLSESENTLSTGASMGCLSKGDIVSTDTMQINVKTVSGKVYSADDYLWTEVNKDSNLVMLRFKRRLSNDIYLVQFTSNADNRIIGQFIIDNSSMKSGVNLSQFWVLLMIFGGLLALGAASAYLVPFFIVRVNEARVNQENERIARMKNPEAYATKKKVSFKDALNKLIYNIKTPAYKRKKDTKKEEQPSEEKEYTNRFTEMLRERKEKRDYMREHQVTGEEMEKIKEAEALAAADKENSFAALRDDDDDEIATFHAAQDEISTLETGAYVQDGATFAKLDSMRDEQPPEEPNNHGNDEHGGN
ncbi:MAG: hypothetical protein NC133_04075 [Prevotella sp.]|nr:hypothetical protein [Prevotella sp.]